MSHSFYLQLNREDTFTFEKKEPATKPNLKTTRPVTPKTASRPTIKQSIGGGSERKALRMVSKEISATPKFARKTVQSSNE